MNGKYLTQKIAIIGSGPIATVLSYYLISKNFEVTMFDFAGSVNSNDTPNYVSLTHLSVVDQVGIHISPDFGGFTNIWGGVISKNLEQKSEILIELVNLMSSNAPIAAEGCSCLRFKNTSKKFTIFPASIAVNENKEVWNCGRAITKLINDQSKFHYFNKSLIKQIELNQSTNKYKLIGAKVKDEFDKVLGCAGPVGNAILKINSGLSEEIEIKDTQLFYLPFFSLRKISQFECDSNACSSILQQNESESDIVFQTQLYSHINFYSNKIYSMNLFIPRWIIKALLNLLNGRLHVALIYTPSKYSDSLIIKSNNGQVIATKKINRVRKVKQRKFAKILSKELRNNNFFVTTKFIKYMSVGKSYHLGGHLNLKNLEQKENGIFFYGSSEMSNPSPGAITLQAIEHSLRKLEDDFKLPKF